MKKFLGSIPQVAGRPSPYAEVPGCKRLLFNAGYQVLPQGRSCPRAWPIAWAIGGVVVGAVLVSLIRRR